MNKTELPKGLKDFFKYSWYFYVIAIIISIAGIMIIEAVSPTPVIPFNWSWNNILMFVAVCGGIGWIIHGTGFLLIKVN